MTTFIVILSVLAICGLLIVLRANSLSKSTKTAKVPEDHKDDHGTPTSPQPAQKNDHGASHGSSGGHGGGDHGHGGGFLSTLAVIAFVVLCGFGVYLFAQELQSIPPKTMHPIQVQEASSNSAPLDTDPAHYCKAPAPDATSYPAKPEEWTEVSVTPGGYEFCTNPGPATGLVEFECRMDEGGSWESCGQTFLFVRFKSKMPVTVWQEPYHS